MAGRKQHFIPQALLRGFGVAKGKATRVYVYRRGQPPYRSSTEGVAAQRDFYSEPSIEQSLDDKITTYEGTILAPAISAMREVLAGPIDSNLAAAVVVHLSLRSAFVRGSFSAVAIEILDYFLGAMRSEKTARALLEVDSMKAESKLVKLIEEEIISRFATIPESGKCALAKLAHFRAREKLPDMFPDIAATVLRQFGMLLQDIPTMIISGHSKALERDLAPMLRVERLKAMNWRIIATELPTHFVLPDCLAVGSRTSDFQELAPYSLLSDDDIVGIAMPVCSSKLLVGCFGNPELDVASLNRSFAQCSLDFFISSEADSQTSDCAQHIGSTVAKYVTSLVEKNAFAAPERVGSDRESQESKCEVTTLVKVPIRFEPPNRNSAKARASIRSLLGAPELEMGMRIVESIVVANDVASSLRQRGVVLNEDTSQTVRLGTCETKETPSGVSCQLFFPMEAVKFVAEGHPISRTAAALIRHQAGRATYYATVVTKLPTDTLQRKRPLLEAVCMRIAHFFCSHYFGGRLSGRGDISDAEFAATDSFCVQTLASCLRGTTDARLHFLEHRNVDETLVQALGHTEQLLCAIANACATTGDEIDRWKASKTVEALQAVGLGEWFKLFELDLERFFNARDTPSEEHDLVLLGSHVERVLWSFGIVLSTRTTEQIWMDVVGDEQLEGIRRMLRD